VTVCGTLQSRAVKIRLDAETVPSVVSLEEIGMETGAVGSEVRTTVKVAVPPDSVVVVELGVPTVMLATSSSRFVKVRSAGSLPC
jgi:uncharacterized lipoprotein YbaY